MGFFDSISEGIKRKFDRNEQDRLMIEGLQKEANAHRKMAFEEAFKKDARVVAEALAKQDAARMSGLQKLRATNRSRNLQTNPQTPGSFFEKLSAYTQKNVAEREKNLAKTEEMRKVAKTEREKQLANRQLGRVIPQKAPLLRDRKSTWGR